MSEPMTGLLADLQLADPDPARSERTRTRCRARLARAQRASGTPAPGPRGRTVLLWQPLIAVLSVAYFAAAIVQALRAYAVP
jgi:hypothetical protein